MFLSACMSFIKTTSASGLSLFHLFHIKICTLHQICEYFFNHDAGKALGVLLWRFSLMRNSKVFCSAEHQRRAVKWYLLLKKDATHLNSVHRVLHDFIKVSLWKTKTFRRISRFWNYQRSFIWNKILGHLYDRRKYQARMVFALESSWILKSSLTVPSINIAHTCSMIQSWLSNLTFAGHGHAHTRLCACLRRSINKNCLSLRGFPELSIIAEWILREIWCKKWTGYIFLFSRPQVLIAFKIFSRIALR